MRIAFFILVLVNIAFLAWAGWIDAAPRAAAARSNSGISKLVLASEMKATSNAAANVGSDAAAGVAASAANLESGAARVATSAGKLETAAAGARCVSVGPFNTLQRSAGAATVLQQRGLAPRQRSEQGETWG